MTCVKLQVIHLVFQVVVRARDQSQPEQEALATVKIIVNRDEFPPTVERGEYPLKVSENRAPNDGVSLLQIEAEDRDLTGTLRFEVVGDLAAPSFFSVDDSGNVLLVRSLRMDIADSYTVSEIKE